MHFQVFKSVDVSGAHIKRVSGRWTTYPFTGKRKAWRLPALIQIHDRAIKPYLFPFSPSSSCSRQQMLRTFVYLEMWTIVVVILSWWKQTFFYAQFYVPITYFMQKDRLILDNKSVYLVKVWDTWSTHHKLIRCAVKWAEANYWVLLSWFHGAAVSLISLILFTWTELRLIHTSTCTTLTVSHCLSSHHRTTFSSWSCMFQTQNLLQPSKSVRILSHLI